MPIYERLLVGEVRKKSRIRSRDNDIGIDNDGARIEAF